jgi:hypothetical protein
VHCNVKFIVSTIAAKSHQLKSSEIVFGGIVPRASNHDVERSCALFGLAGRLLALAMLFPAGAEFDVHVLGDRLSSLFWA